MIGENYKVGNYIYYEADDEYSVGKICKVVKNTFGNMLRCYWSEHVDKLPKTIKEFDKIKKREYDGFMYDTDEIVHKLNLIDDTKSTSSSTKCTIEHIINGNKTIVIVHNPDGTYSKGETKCCPEDKFDATDGFFIAYLRAIGEKVDVTDDEINYGTEEIIDFSDVSNEELLDELNKRLKK